MGEVICSHADSRYIERSKLYGEDNRWNGELMYSVDIVNRIVPAVTTDRPWVTVNVYGACADRAIVFIHNNVTQTIYEWLADYHDLILVCGRPETVPKVSHLGTSIYLPLSIDVADVQSHARTKDREACAFGRPEKMGFQFPEGTDVLPPMPRNEALDAVARYRKCYAVGRCAIESKALGCEVMAYDPRYPNPAVWRVLDVSQAASILQRELDAIDG